VVRANPATLWSLALASTCCQGPPPAAPDHAPIGIDRRAGETFLAAHAHYGIPILQKSFFWDGNGEVDNAGLGVQGGHFLADNVALGGKLVATNWMTGGRDVYSGELEGLLRIYPWADGPLFVDGTAGYQLANDQIPPGGTLWNFSFGFGAGLDFPVGEGTSLLLGAAYHHISNALGSDNERNPSQNEARLWVGFGWAF